MDLAAGQMYWIEARLSPEWWRGRILRFDLDGSNTEVLITGLERPEEIALDVVEGKLYWTDKQGGSIHRADLDGGNVEEVVTGLVRPVGIALDVPLPDTPPRYGTNPHGGSGNRTGGRGRGVDRRICPIHLRPGAPFRLERRHRRHRPAGPDNPQPG